MKRIRMLACLLLAVLTVRAGGDPRCLHLMGIDLEGPVDSLQQRLVAAGFREWGGSDDGEDYYFRGAYYGIRAKLLVSTSPETRLVTSAYVTVGPYSTQKMLEHNRDYFLRKLQKEHGELTARGGSWVAMDDYGSVKLSVVDNSNGSRDIRIFYLPAAAYYKDAAIMGFRGRVQEVVTENAVAEDQFLHFTADGQLDTPDLTERRYDCYGYLRHARMNEQEGYSDVAYDYDSLLRLSRRTLTNATASIRYVNEYTYHSDGEMLSQSRKVYHGEECILVVTMHNKVLTRDEYGNWTTNQLTLSYWEKGGQQQQTTVLQKRTIIYYE